MTVLTLAPLGLPLPKSWLAELGAPRVATKYPNSWPSNSNAAAGIKALDTALHTTAGDLVVYGHSMGAQVAAKWLREIGLTSDIDPARVRFYLTGNPERPGGRGGNYPGGKGGVGIPPDTRYTVTDITRKGDFWSDSGSFLTGTVIHCNYGNVHLSVTALAPDATTAAGNVTYITVP
jgi:hypothetical protein